MLSTAHPHHEHHTTRVNPRLSAMTLRYLSYTANAV